MKALAKRSLGILFAAALCLACELSSFAEVYTERSGGGKADSVYVAGNPELYPIEYYDNARGEYRGLVPDMLRDISSRTGIDFTYISAGDKNVQKDLADNLQAELVTAIPRDDADFTSLELYTVLTVEKDGALVEYCIGFTGKRQK